MPVIKGNYAQNFTTVPNTTLQDKSISFDARGVLCLMLSMPADWSMYKAWLVQQCPKTGKDKMTRILAELESAGYLVRNKKRDDAGRFDSYVWYVYPEKFTGNGLAVAGSAVAGKSAPTKETVKQSKQEQSPLLGEIVDMYLSIVKDNCNAKGCLKDHFLSSKERVKPLLARISENEEHQKEEFWQAYFNNCKTISWIRDGIDGEAVCTIDMLINKTKFYRNVEAFWA